MAIQIENETTDKLSKPSPKYSYLYNSGYFYIEVRIGDSTKTVAKYAVTCEKGADLKKGDSLYPPTGLKARDGQSLVYQTLTLGSGTNVLEKYCNGWTESDLVETYNSAWKYNQRQYVYQ